MRDSRLAIVPLPSWHEGARARGETHCLRINVAPQSIGGVSVFHVPYRPGLAGLCRAYRFAREFMRVLQPST